MSLILNQKTNVFAYIENKKGQREGTISINQSDAGDGCDHVELDDGYKFCLAPKSLKDIERQTLFVAGESGAGKSHYIREYAKRYRKMFPNNPIYLISYLEKDKTLDECKEITRIKQALTPEFLNVCMDMDLEAEFENSLVIFDDIDSISPKTDKKTKDTIYGFLNKMLKIGRHYGIGVAYLGHELYRDLGSILNESMTITFFPRFLNYSKLKYLLKEYLGLSDKQIKSIRSIKDRSITFIKGEYKVILSDRQCFILEDDF